MNKPKAEQPEKQKRVRISQSDVPAHSLTEALRVPLAISENYGSQPSKPLSVAAAMKLSPTSSQFKMLTGASIAYGLTEGGYNASEIALTPLAKQISSPLEEGEDYNGKVEAFLKPRIISEFVRKYDGHAIPREEIAYNVLTDMGVPKERSASVLELIMDGASDLGLISEIKGKKYINLSGNRRATIAGSGEAPSDLDSESDDADLEGKENHFEIDPQRGSRAVDLEDEKRNRRVFITHGKNKVFVDPIKKLLSFGEMEAVVSIEKQTVSQPVPEKVLNDMRSCGAAIIHVDSENIILDQEGKESIVLNPNVLIEIGAAMALYGKRFILLVRDGVTLPSNLQGLFEVRYEGDTLDGMATIKLLEAIKDMKATKPAI